MHQETTTEPQGEARSATGKSGLIDLHQPICAGDVEAAEALADLLGPRLIDHLRARFPRTDADTLADGATDAILDYLAHPSRFNPTRASLESFLRTVAWRKVRDLQRAEDRRRCREVLTPNEVLEQWPAPGGGVSADGETAKAEEIWQARLLDFDHWLTGLSELDRTVMRLWRAGEHQTAPFAHALGMEHLPKEEQQDRVHRAKRRLWAKVTRWARTQ